MNSQNKICAYLYEDFLKMVKDFHGHAAPGVVIGGFMVDLAMTHLPEGELFDALSETRSCLPDAIQLLTPCTVGNGWLKIVDTGRYALTLYKKFGGDGVRVFVDSSQLNLWPEIKNWFFKIIPKQEQDKDKLMNQIREAANRYFGIQKVKLGADFIKTRPRMGFSVCPICREGFPKEDGPMCLSCRGDSPYLASYKPAN